MSLPEYHHCQNPLVQINPPSPSALPPPLPAPPLQSAFHRFATLDRPLSSSPRIPPFLLLRSTADSPDERFVFTLSPLSCPSPRWSDHVSLHGSDSSLLASPREAERKGRRRWGVGCRLPASQMNDIIGIPSIHWAAERRRLGGWEGSVVQMRSPVWQLCPVSDSHKCSFTPRHHYVFLLGALEAVT